MKSRYETGPSCTPDTQLFALLNSKATEKNVNKSQKQEIWVSLSEPEHILLKRLYQFIATASVYLDTAK